MQEQPYFITDRIAEADKYAALNPRFPKAIGFLKRPDLASLPCGRYEIIPGECWAMVVEADLKPCSAMKLEAHRRYIDIQAPLSREEAFGVFTMNEKTPIGDFDEKKDICFFEVEDRSSVRVHTLRKGEFAVFFPPYGGHAPCCSEGELGKIKKLVIKILAD